MGSTDNIYPIRPVPSDVKKNNREKIFKVSNTEESVTSLDNAIFSLLTAKTTGEISSATIDAMVLALQEAKCPQTVVQQSLNVSILLLNEEGDASICFKYCLANFGRRSLPGRTHKFWFTAPQKDVQFSASTESGRPLDVELTNSNANFNEVMIHFPKCLEPSDQLVYSIQYKVLGEFVSPVFDIRARTITNRISLTVLSPENFTFANTSVGMESADGYISDSPPLPLTTTEYGRQKLVWNYRSAKTGDQFRTVWELAPLKS